MRIISQNGIIDLPYENIGISINCCNKKDIVAYPAVYYGKDNGHWTLAEYSTEEKAKKAMEMLRTAYLSRMKLDGGYDMVHGCYVQPNYWVLPKVFQFPQDEDVEV